MQKPCIAGWVLSVGLMALGAQGVSGQDFPNRPIRIVTSGIGGGTDLAARLVALGLTESLGQQVIVDNRGSGIIPGEIVSRASPDGYSLLLATGGLLWLLPYLQDNVPYDPVRDFAPVTLAASFPTVLATNPSLPAKSINELLALARVKPGTINYVMTAIGGSAHLAAELLKSMTGVDIVRIQYKNAGTAIGDLIAGHVQLFFSASGPVMPHVKTGRLRALAVTSPKPSVLLPELPTVAASVPGYEIEAMYGIFAPAKTPAAIVNRLNQEIVRVLARTAIREKFLNAGMEPVGSSPEALGAARKSDMIRMSKVIKDAGIRGN